MVATKKLIRVIWTTLFRVRGKGVGGGGRKERRGELTSEETDEDEPGRLDLLPGRAAVHDAPDARDLVDVLFVLGLLVCLGGAQHVLDALDDFGPVVAHLFLEERSLLVDLVVRSRFGRGVEGLLDLLDQLAHCLVRLRRHEGKLQDNNGGRHEEVEQEEAPAAESALCGLIDDAVQ
jgi:hypothetical protein